ncbi:30S ribosomal protein S17 [Candidatus Dojkabacteria bacterium]|nr:30S ribosomal protein S17 [Candidatus Dojkabacteria bacterium]
MKKTNKRQQKNKEYEQESRSRKKVLQGEVVSNKMLNTVVVKVTSRNADPLYGKIITRSKKYKAHTNEDIKVGTIVSIEQCRPISKAKRWRVIPNIDGKES